MAIDSPYAAVQNDPEARGAVSGVGQDKHDVRVRARHGDVEVEVAVEVGQLDGRAPVECATNGAKAPPPIPRSTARLSARWVEVRTSGILSPSTSPIATQVTDVGPGWTTVAANVPSPCWVSSGEGL